MEIALIEQFLEQNKPILGICRGCQILNIALGGDMYQDLASQKQTILQHAQDYQGIMLPIPLLLLRIHCFTPFKKDCPK